MRNAPTIPRELTVLERYTFDPDRFARMRAPTLLMVGENQPARGAGERPHRRSRVARRPRAGAATAAASRHVYRSRPLRARGYPLRRGVKEPAPRRPPGLVGCEPAPDVINGHDLEVVNIRTLVAVGGADPFGIDLFSMARVRRAVSRSSPAADPGAVTNPSGLRASAT